MCYWHANFFVTFHKPNYNLGFVCVFFKVSQLMGEYKCVCVFRNYLIYAHVSRKGMGKEYELAWICQLTDWVDIFLIIQVDFVCPQQN